MMRWGLLALVASCVSSNSVECEFGLCPNGTSCDAVHHLCVLPDQLTACATSDDNEPCSAGAISGFCEGHVCLPQVCSDGIVEPPEACDDGNTVDTDDCSADCLSAKQCGNLIVDVLKGEQCDDGNQLDHDGCSSHCLIETPHWVQHAMAPAARYDPNATYDARRDRIVMFSGNVPGTLLPIAIGDTWEFDGREWQPIHTPAAPPGRTNAAFAYDSVRGEVVMFGGLVDGLFPIADMWTYDGVRWTALDTSGPSAREATAAAFDTHRGKLVMFGGLAYDNTGTAVVLDETWEWNGLEWKQATPAHKPPGRVLASAVYDPKRGAIVLAGGKDLGSTTFQDTWVFDGTDWQNLSPSGAIPQVWEAAAAFDPTNNRVVMFGGINASNTVVATVSALSGTTWTTVTTSGGMTARRGSAFSAFGNKLIAFGGAPTSVNSPFNETWSLTGTVWAQLKEPGPREGHILVGDPLNARGILYGGASVHNGTKSAETWSVPARAAFSLLAGTPTARTNACSAYDYAHDTIVMFGGNTGALVNETWVWSGGAWQQKTPPSPPSVRQWAACGYDGQHVILFGGDSGSANGETWSWDGTQWTKLTPAMAPSPRYGAIAGYDPVRKQLVLFGGISASVPMEDTWVWDGTTWTPKTGFHPSARFRGSLVWNPARQRLVLFGGSGAAPIIDLDAYEWDGEKWSTIAAENPPPARYDSGGMSSLDGAGIFVYAGFGAQTNTTLDDQWELRWDADATTERCTGNDLDGDGLNGCADPDCWPVCAPLCPPATTCNPSAPKCGDGICDANRETCRTCPADCTCAPVCGDGFCDSGETCPGDCP